MRDSKPLVLVVNDDPQMHELVRAALRADFGIVSAGNALDAKEQYLCHTDAIAAVIVNAALPVHDGVSLLSWFLGQSDVPPMIMTAEQDTEESLAARELWGDTPGVFCLETPCCVSTLRQLTKWVTQNAFELDLSRR